MLVHGSMKCVNCGKNSNRSVGEVCYRCDPEILYPASLVSMGVSLLVSQGISRDDISELFDIAYMSACDDKTSGQLH